MHPTSIVTRIRLLAAAVVLAGSVAGTAAAQESDPALVQAALKEGKVMAYGELITPTWRSIKEGFEKKYPGITMEFVYLSGAPMMNRIMSEQDAGRYVADILALDTLRLPALLEKGYLANYVSPQQQHYEKSWWSDPPGYWIQNHVYLAGIMYNKKIVPAAEAPKSFEDLLDPKWTGKIAMVSPVANDLMLYLFAGLIRDMGEERAFALFEKLAAQKPYIFGPGGIRVSQGVNTGEFPIGVGFIGHVYSVGSGESGNMGLVPTKPTYAVSGPGIAVMAHAPNPNAARLLVDYMHSKEVQEMIASLGYFSSYPNIKAQPSMEGLSVTVAPSPQGDAAATLRARIQKIFGL
ncbi:MAG TPA: extracellular solute-binding protein [Azospirillum sp.]|nr:extracellular solute-binding protein [Azospirillum sp.]